jgi:hypothetical protein
MLAQLHEKRSACRPEPPPVWEKAVKFRWDGPSRDSMRHLGALPSPDERTMSQRHHVVAQENVESGRRTMRTAFAGAVEGAPAPSPFRPEGPSAAAALEPAARESPAGLSSMRLGSPAIARRWLQELLE